MKASVTSMSTTRYSSLVFVAAVVVGCLHYVHLSTLNENHVGFSKLSNLQRELFFRTELGFYYGFFKQLVYAPSLRYGITQALLNDDLSEYGSSINAVGRFNLYPEVILAAFYRSLRPLLNEAWIELPVFYSESVFLLNGFLMSGFFLFAYAASSGAFEAAILAVTGYFFNHGECTRVMWAAPLRESFSVPFLFWQQWILLEYLQRAPTHRHRCLLILTTVLFLLNWQFAPFVAVFQICALFGCHVLNSFPSQQLREQLLCYLLSWILVSVLQFGNRMLLTGLFPASLLSIWICSFAKLDRLDTFRRLAVAGVLLIGLTISTKIALTTLSGQASGTDDSHIYQLLRAKFDLNFHTFDTKLYLCAPEFRFYDSASLVNLSKSFVLPMALATVILSVLRLQGASALVRTPILYVLLQLAALSVLAGLISRLKVLFTPQLILTASMLLHKNLCPVSIHDRRAFAAALIATMAVCGIPNWMDQHNIVGQYSNPGLEQVVHWILDSTDSSDSFVGPMTIMATVRETTFRPIYNHPHYEDAGLRQRTRLAYSMYSRKPLEEIWRIHKEQIRARFVIAERALCFAKPSETCGFPEIWDFEDDVNRGKVPTCEALLGTNSSGRFDPYFHIMFENDEFVILEVGDGVGASL